MLNGQIWEWYQSSHLKLAKKANRYFSHNVKPFLQTFRLHAILSFCDYRRMPYENKEKHMQDNEAYELNLQNGYYTH